MKKPVKFPEFERYKRGEQTAQDAINRAAHLDEALAIIREHNYRTSGERDDDVAA